MRLRHFIHEYPCEFNQSRFPCKLLEPPHTLALLVNENICMFLTFSFRILLRYYICRDCKASTHLHLQIEIQNKKELTNIAVCCLICHQGGPVNYFAHPTSLEWSAQQQNERQTKLREGFWILICFMGFM